MSSLIGPRLLHIKPIGKRHFVLDGLTIRFDNGRVVYDPQLQGQMDQNSTVE
jgi:hypothetical protein